ncbi:hypothetical protein [Streptomyces sp. NPDC090025]|uniref:effector-associated constant component EACC1 n=1 Tax=Streptomyces sp. NPDC090025 TaxID=3365922 RepID=UPI003837850A
MTHAPSDDALWALDLGLVPRSSRFDEHDENWIDQERELLDALDSRTTDGITLRRTPASAVPGHKGLLDTVVVALTSASALRVAADCWKTWLRRDRTRSVEIVYPGDDGTEQRLRIDAKQLDDGQFDRLYQVLDELGRRRWPR